MCLNKSFSINDILKLERDFRFRSKHKTNEPNTQISYIVYMQ